MTRSPAFAGIIRRNTIDSVSRSAPDEEPPASFKGKVGVLEETAERLHA